MVTAKDVVDSGDDMQNRREDLYVDDVGIDGFKKNLDKALKDPNFDPDAFIESLLVKN
jgi:hypothetical protein